MTEEKYNTKDIRHINKKNQEYIAEGNRMTEEINKGCEFQSDCIEYKDISYLKVMPICAIHELSIACHKVNKCKYYELYKQLKRLEQECDELKKTVENQKLEYEELQCDLSEVENACGCYQSENAELKQENKDLKKQIESDQGLITVGGKQQYEYLQRINELEQENKSLQAYKDINEDFKKAWDELNEKYKQLRSALEEIREIVKADCKGCTAECDCDEDCTRYMIKNKINEVLNLS